MRFSEGTGSVEVTWVHQQDGKLILRWIERGGPPPRPPTRVGFGTRLIRDLLAQETGWQVSLDYAPQGLQCTMLIAVDQNKRLSHSEDYLSNDHI
jgi:two-component sensor histidine kinase